MNISLIARGGVPVKLDRERIVFFNMIATGLLLRKYGRAFWREIFTLSDAPVAGDEPKAETTYTPPEIKDIEALQYALWCGLQVDAERRGETLTLDQVADFIRPMTLALVADAILLALTFSFETPILGGKAKAAAASPAEAAPKGKGRKRASTTQKRKPSRSASSAGLPGSSSKRR